MSLRLRPLAFLLLGQFSLPASAGPSDAIHLYTGIVYGRDDNLLRVADGDPGFGNIRSDSWWERDGGISFDKEYSRQRISISARLSRYDFERFKQLDYTGENFNATWFWQLGSYFEGKIGTRYELTLAPYTDLATDERNLRRTRSDFAEASWKYTASWRGKISFQRDKYQYELLVQRYNNRIENAGELSFDYLSSRGSTIGLVARQVRGEYPDSREFGPSLLNNNFVQDELKLRVIWLVTASTTLDALVGYSWRKQPSFDSGTTKGLAGKVNAAYKPRSSVVYSAALWRDFAPLESTAVSYSLNRGASVATHFELTAKIKVDAETVYERRSYNVRSGFSGLDDLRDSLRNSRLSASWAVRPTVEVTTGFAHEQRRGSNVLGNGSFTSNSATLSVSGQF